MSGDDGKGSTDEFKILKAQMDKHLGVTTMERFKTLSDEKIE